MIYKHLFIYKEYIVGIQSKKKIRHYETKSQDWIWIEANNDSDPVTLTTVQG